MTTPNSCFCDAGPRPDPPNVSRILLRDDPANPPVFQQQDIIPEEGDIFIIRSREKQTFYTAGLLGGGEHPLPRDKDLEMNGYPNCGLALRWTAPGSCLEIS